jgi:outer membrane protein assembly factor BamA
MVLGLTLQQTAGVTFGGEDSAIDGKWTDTEPGELVLAPVPMLQPALGGGLVMVGMQFHPHDSGSPANITGAAAGYTSTESYLIAVAHDHHLDGDLWRLQGAAGYAKFNLNFNGIGAEAGDPGQSLSYSVEGTFLEPRLLRKFSNGWSGGFSAQFLDAKVNFEDFESGDPILDTITSEELSLTSIGVGLITERDTRDYRFAPSTGKYFQATTSLFPSALSNDLDYRIYAGAYSQYWQVRSSTVLAVNVSTAYADGEVPFYRLSKLNIRGVSGDTYWDRFLLQGQAEVRQWVNGNWGAAVFAGYGGVSSSFKNLDGDKMILAGGAGIRYLVSSAQRIAVRLDIAKGQDDIMMYISVGEAF